MIWERETEYQYARVTERPNGERRLELNEGQAVHSVYRPGEWLTDDYWDEMLVLPVRDRPAARRARWRSSATPPAPPRAPTATSSRRTRVDGVEIDPALTDVGRRLFDLRGPNLHLHTADARPFLRRASRRWDVIIVDAYRQPYIPFYLATREFFGEVRDHLTPGGMVLINVGHPERLGPPGEGPRRHDGPGVQARPARSRQGDQQRARRHRRAGLGRARCDAATRALPPDLAAVTRRGRRAGWRPRCPAAPSTPTTARRSSG